jgi:hypothetical protein
MVSLPLKVQEGKKVSLSIDMWHPKVNEAQYIDMRRAKAVDFTRAK